MLKQICIVLLGITFLTTFTHSAPLSNKTQDEDLILDPFDELSFGDPESYVSTGLPKGNEGSLTNEQQRFPQEMLTAHNNYRKCHGASPLILDAELSNSAQQYAEYLASIQQMIHSDPSARNNAGENLYSMYDSNGIGDIAGNVPTDSWYSEVKYYDFNNGDFSMTTGHFTQLVWKSSQRLGVGIGFTSDGNSVYVVARYSPAGNVEGQYQENVFPGQC